MPQLCLAVASLALSTSRPVSVVLLANRLSLVLPYLLWYHTLLSSAVVSKRKHTPILQDEQGCTIAFELIQLNFSLKSTIYRSRSVALTRPEAPTRPASELTQMTIRCHEGFGHYRTNPGSMTSSFYRKERLVEMHQSAINQQHALPITPYHAHDHLIKIKRSEEHTS